MFEKVLGKIYKKKKIEIREKKSQKHAKLHGFLWCFLVNFIDFQSDTLGWEKGLGGCEGRFRVVFKHF